MIKLLRYNRRRTICSNEKVELIDVRKQAQLRVSDNNQLKAIYTPVIVVAGMGECCNKLEVQIDRKSVV